MPQGLLSTEPECYDTVLDDPFEIPWHKSAACYNKGTELYFHEGLKNAKPVARQAKAQCMSCPVRDLCLQSSLEHRDRYGIWGGLTPSERARLLSRIDAGDLTIDQAVWAVTHVQAA
jgi:WhiB family redox-sensing transcriptional regulator